MNEKILIVEDQVEDADELQAIILETNYRLYGIVTSYEAAQEISQTESPDMALINVYLEGKPAGIELARVFRNKNIPFIFLSSDSNDSTLDAIKGLHPYGFLIKPLRKQDVLAALVIGIFRYKHDQDLKINLGRWLKELLLSIISKPGNEEQKLLLIAKAFQPFIHFDTVIFNVNLKGGQTQPVYAFQRVDFDEYKRKDHRAIIKNANLREEDLNLYRQRNLLLPAIRIENDGDFDQLCKEYKFTRMLRDFFHINSGLVVPVITEKETYASVGFYSVQRDPFTSSQAELIAMVLPLLATVISTINEQYKITDSKGITNQSISDLRSPALFKGIVGKSLKLLFVMDQITQIAPYNTTVLIQGETGSGKEALVDAIHQISPRRNKPLIKINCVAIPGSLVESELFGYERGAFTGATERQIGIFEQAQGGTIFLDEIGDISPEVQTKLLRVLQEKEIQRIGGRTIIKIDVRIIVATNRNLNNEVAAGRFRSDLYYRINVFLIQVPPLRERKEDIPLLVDHFLDHSASAAGTLPKRISPDVIQQLMNYSWPGNIRELQHLIERTVLITKTPEITEITLPEYEIAIGNESDATGKLDTLEEVERKYILQVIKSCNGRINGKGGAAEILNLPPTTLNLKMKRLGIVWEYTYKPEN